jgi:hypothetical protein
VYRLPLEDGRARYYRHALPVRAEFEAAGGLPGGKTRTTLKKLQAATVPRYDAEVDLRPLDELADELAAVRERIERTDRLIDLVVYRLYGLGDGEVAVVEGQAGA